MSPGMRQFHRWMSVALTLAVIATTIAMSQKEPIVWMSYIPLIPLALLYITGVYLFLLSHLTKRRRRQNAH